MLIQGERADFYPPFWPARVVRVHDLFSHVSCRGRGARGATQGAIKMPKQINSAQGSAAAGVQHNRSNVYSW